MAKRTAGKVTPKKSFEILASTPEAHKKLKGFYDDKHPDRKSMMLDKYGRCIIHDAGIAKEIQQRFGAKKYGGSGDFTVIPVEETRGRSRRKTYSFSRIPWKE